MRLKLAILMGAILAILPLSARAQVAFEHINSATLNLARVADGGYRDFAWQWSGYDTQVIDMTWTNPSGAFASGQLYFRLASPMDGTIYIDEGPVSPVHTDSGFFLRIPYTNIPPVGNYYGDVLVAVSNVSRSVAQGKVSVTHSVFNNDAEYFNVVRTNAETGQIYVHPNWIDVGDFPAFVINHNDTMARQGGTDGEYYHLTLAQHTNALAMPARMVTAEAELIRLDGIKLETGDAGTSTNLSDYNDDIVAGTTVNGESGAVTLEGRTNMTVTTDGTTVYFDADFTAPTALYRYDAGSNVAVLATASNVTAALVGTTYTITGDAGTQLLSARVIHDGTLGSSFTLVVSTNLIVGSSLTDRWLPNFNAVREDTGDVIAGAKCRLDLSNHDRFTIQGLWTGGNNHCKFGF